MLFVGEKKSLKPDILLTGVCYVFILLKMRYENKLSAAIKVVKPNYDTKNIKLINDEFNKRIKIVDFYGRLGEKKYSSFYDLLESNSGFKKIYSVSNIELDSEEVVAKDFWRRKGEIVSWNRKILGGGFWHHVYDKKWDANTARLWRETRKLAMLDVLRDFPNLKFIVCNEKSLKWWKENHLPQDRIIYWDVEWIASGDWRERQEEIRKLGGFGFHNFPTEESYQELYELILKDAKN